MYKQVIVVRKDIKMGKGKLAAQVAHASLEAFLRSSRSVRKKWLSSGAKKVVLKASDLRTLKRIKKKAESLGLTTAMIRDAGRTQLRPGTITCLGIGPAEEDKINMVTGKLKML